MAIQQKKNIKYNKYGKNKEYKNNKYYNKYYKYKDYRKTSKLSARELKNIKLRLNRINFYIIRHLKYTKFLQPAFRFYIYRRVYKKIYRIVRRKFNNKLTYLRYIVYIYWLYNLYNRKKKLKVFKFNRYRKKKFNKFHFRSKVNKKFVIKKVTRLDKLLMIKYLINNLFKKGFKAKGYYVFINLLLLLKYKHKLSIIKIIYTSIYNVKPLISFKTLYIGGKKYKIPVLLTFRKSYKYALKWIINSSKDNNKNNFILSLLNEFIDAYKNTGDSVKKRKDFHLLAYENKSYIRFLRFLKS